MKVVPAEEEVEAEVRREDQNNINRFARLNARLHELRAERALIEVSFGKEDTSPVMVYVCETSLSHENWQKTLERLDDASTELMMASGDKVMLLVGEAFFDTSEEDATEFCEAEVERFQAQLDKLETEEETIVEEQKKLKEILYGRFGRSIQLDE